MKAFASRFYCLCFEVLDVGHYTEAGYDPIPFLQKHHDRITNLHLKDMKCLAYVKEALA